MSLPNQVVVILSDESSPDSFRNLEVPRASRAMKYRIVPQVGSSCEKRDCIIQRRQVFPTGSRNIMSKGPGPLQAGREDSIGLVGQFASFRRRSGLHHIWQYFIRCIDQLLGWANVRHRGEPLTDAIEDIALDSFRIPRTGKSRRRSGHSLRPKHVVHEMPHVVGVSAARRKTASRNCDAAFSRRPNQVISRPGIENSQHASIHARRAEILDVRIGRNI